MGTTARSPHLSHHCRSAVVPRRPSRAARILSSSPVKLQVPPDDANLDHITWIPAEDLAVGEGERDPDAASWLSLSVFPPCPLQEPEFVL